MRMTRNTLAAMLIAFVILGAFAGCSGTPNPKDPKEVGEAYWNAIIAEDYSTAQSYVLPDNQERFRTRMVPGFRQLPPLPDQPEIIVKVDGDRGEVILENWIEREGAGTAEIVLREGRWWVLGI
jgi:hypothetical protein